MTAALIPARDASTAARMAIGQPNAPRSQPLPASRESQRSQSMASAYDPPSPRPPPCKRGAELFPVLAETPCGEAATLMRGAEPQNVETQTDKWLSACELPEPNPVSLMRMSGTRQWDQAVKADEVQENMAQSRGRCATSYDDKPILSKTTTTGCTIISRALPLQRLEDPCGEASSPLLQQHWSPDRTCRL